MALAQSMARIQKHQVHDASWLMSAPKTAPAVAPVGPAAPKVAKAMLRLKPTGYVRPIRAMALGTSRAGPMPCIARQTLKSTTPLPWQKPQTSDQSENHAQPIWNILLCPYISPSLPAAGFNLSAKPSGAELDGRTRMSVA